MSAWNTRPIQYADKLGAAYISKQSAFRNAGIYILVALVAAASSQYG